MPEKKVKTISQKTAKTAAASASIKNSVCSALLHVDFEGEERKRKKSWLPIDHVIVFHVMLSC